MKKAILFLISFLSMALLQAQPGGPPPHEESEKVRSLRVAFITQKLNLSSAEAEKFWPVYNEFQDAVAVQHRKRFDCMRKLKDEMDKLSDAQIEEQVKLSFDAELKIVELRKTYHERFLKVLNSKKVALLYATEIEFQRKVIQQINKRADRPRP
jgi:hypothetical protein